MILDFQGTKRERAFFSREIGCVWGAGTKRFAAADAHLQVALLVSESSRVQGHAAGPPTGSDQTVNWTPFRDQTQRNAIGVSVEPASFAARVAIPEDGQSAVKERQFLRNRVHLVPTLPVRQWRRARRVSSRAERNGDIPTFRRNHGLT